MKVSGPRKWGPSGFNNPGGSSSEKKVEPAPSFEASPTPDPSPSPFAAKPAAKPAAPEPVELTEREKMAAALFSGMGPTKAAPKPTFAGATIGGSSQASPPAAAPAPKAAPEPVAAAPPAPAPSAGVDLLDMGFDDFAGPPAKAAAAPPPPPARPAAPVDDMLLLDMGSSDTGTDLLGAPTNVSPPAPAQTSPFLGPLSVTTAQVGGMWNQLASERRMQIQTSIGNCKEMMMRLQNAVNVNPVEIIGMEGIAAGRVLPGNDPVFLHGKLAPPRLDLLVRCQNPAVAEKTVEICKQALA